MTSLSKQPQDVPKHAISVDSHVERLSLRSESLRPAPIELDALVSSQRQAGQTIYNFGLPEHVGFPSCPGIEPQEETTSNDEVDRNEKDKAEKNRAEKNSADSQTGVAQSRTLSSAHHHPTGTLALKRSILRWSEADTSYHPENVVVGSGANQSILHALLAICDPGDSVIVPPIPRESYLELVKMSGCRPMLAVSTGEAQSGRIRRESLLRQFASCERIRAVLLCNPCNPTGEVYTANELREILDICADYGVYVLLDRRLWRTIPTEVRKDIALDSKAHLPWLIHIDSISGDFESSVGLRVGWTISPSDVAERIANLQKHGGSGAATPSQMMAIEMMNAADSAAEDMRADFLLKRALWEKHSRDIPHVTIYPTSAGVYSYWDISEAIGMKTAEGRILGTADDVSEYLLESFSVISTPGSAFLGEDLSSETSIPPSLRFSFGTEKEAIIDGLARVRRAFELLEP